MSDRYRILLVDDEQDTRELLQAALSADYEVILAKDGFDALERLAQVEPDLLVLDVAMPLMDGIELCRSIRKQPAYQDTQVIFLSAKDDEETIRKTYAAGGNLFVRKPVQPSRLAKNIQISLTRTGAPRPKKRAMESFPHPAPTATAAPPSPTPARIAPAPTPARVAPAPTPARIRATSTPAHGAPASPRAAAPVEAPKPESPSKPRLMIVDDDPEVVTLLELSLQETFEVISASDGLKAIEKIAEYQPDILLLDVMMPKMNGYQLCQSLRRNEAYKTAPLFFLTAKSSRKDREYAARCGADGYITKPFDMKNLQELLGTVLAKPEFRIRPKKLEMKEIRLKEKDEARDARERQDLRDRRDRQENLRRFIDESK